MSALSASTLFHFLLFSSLGGFCLSARCVPESRCGTYGDDFERCNAQLTETIPVGVTYPNTTKHPETVDSLIKLCSQAQETLDIASFYWTLLSADVTPDPDNTSHRGEDLLNSIADAAKRGVRVRIAVSQPQNSQDPPNADLEILKSAGVNVRVVNFTQLMGAGVLHTKFIVADNQSFYIGSANMDWRSLSQVKEMGVIATYCLTMAEDLSKIFSVYWHLGDSTLIPEQWPSSLSTYINKDNPLDLNVNGVVSSVYISSSPKPFNPYGRTNDIDAILDTIRGARKYVNIAVMDYFPMYLYQRPSKFWPVIDDALKKAVIERGVKVKLLVSQWSHSRKTLKNFLASLDSFRTYGWGQIEVKVYSVPSTPEQEKIPFARVNHNKYMVTDSTAYIGTSNWSADYFTNTGGVAFVVSEDFYPARHRNNTLRKSLVDVFYRDWNSPYAKNLTQVTWYR